jgi:hypothetical protein
MLNATLTDTSGRRHSILLPSCITEFVEIYAELICQASAFDVSMYMDPGPSKPSTSDQVPLGDKSMYMEPGPSKPSTSGQQKVSMNCARSFRTNFELNWYNSIDDDLKTQPSTFWKYVCSFRKQFKRFSS